MAVLKIIQSKGKLSSIIKYVTDKNKTEEKIISGIGCNSKNALKLMTETKINFGKEDGRSYTHLIQSFRPGEVTSREAHEIGMELAKEFDGHQVLVSTHKDRKHIHNHFVINSVSLVDGKKLHTSKEDLRHLKERSNDICRVRGLSTIDKPFRSFYLSMGEYKLAEKGESLWKEQLRGAIDEAKLNSKNLLELGNYLRDNFKIDVKIQNKNISYKHPDKQKFTRGKMLGNAYTKEGVNFYFYNGRDLYEKGSKHKKVTSKGEDLGKDIISSIEKIPKKIARDIEKEKIRVEKVKEFKDRAKEREVERERSRGRDR